MLKEIMERVVASELAPGLAPTRRVLRAVRRRYAGAESSRLLETFRGSNLSPDEAIRGKLTKLRGRARQLAEDNDYVKRYLNLICANVVGPDGIRLQAQTLRPDGTADLLDNAALELNWARWGRAPTICGAYDWIELLELVLTCLARDGEIFLIKHPGYAGNSFRYALEVREADWVDHDVNKKVDGREVRLGVERNGDQRVTAYYFHTEHPGRLLGRVRSQNHLRVPASRVIHVYVADRPGQSRGTPWVHTALKRLHHLGGYEEGELVASRAASNKNGYFEVNPDHAGDEFLGDEVSDANEVSQYSEAGTLEVLPPGYRFVPNDPQHPTSAFKDAVKTFLRGASSGLNVSYSALSNDLEGVSFSSIRSGVLEDRVQWRKLQKWIGRKVCDVVYDDWLLWGLTAGAITSAAGNALPITRREKFQRHAWQPRGWDWVDPLKDFQMNQGLVREGFKTRTEVCAEQGRDFTEVLQRLAEEERLAAELGVTLGGPEMMAAEPAPQAEE